VKSVYNDIMRIYEVYELMGGCADLRINEVEQLIDLPKKTIKYYEEEKLIFPKRNSSNSYREYIDHDINVLRQIKLLRKLGFSIEAIRIILNHSEQLKELFQNRIKEIDININSMENVKKLCINILSDNNESSNLDFAKYLERISALEKEGYKFMNAKELKYKKDNKKTIIFIALAVVLVLCSGLFLLPLKWIGPLLFVIIVLGSFIFLVSWHSKKVAYICKDCNEKFVIGFLRDLLSPHLPPDTKYLKCPNCGKRTWAKETYRD